MPTVPVHSSVVRVIPSRFPPINLFDTVSSTDDMYAVMELEGWTNDSRVQERLARLPSEEWVFGIPNASIVMASFLHAAPSGLRFSGPELGAWYAAFTPTTALLEVSHHLRREVMNSNLPEMRSQYRAYSSQLAGRYEDIRGLQTARPDLYNPTDYAASQAFGEHIRCHGDGIVYDSVRHVGGTNVVAYRPKKIQKVMQLDHYELTVPLEGKIMARRLTA